MENNTQEKQEKNRKLIAILLVAVVFLLGINGVLWYQLSNQKEVIKYITEEKEVLSDEKIKVETELNDLMDEYSGLQTNNAELQKEIDDQKAKIEEYLKQIEKHKDDAYIIYKLKKEAGTLREIMKGYIQTIDSINQLNVVLKQEKEVITQELNTQKNKYTELEGEKEELAGKVKVGSRLRALDITVQAQRVKSNNVHRETTKADNTEKIKSCFTIDKNEIAQPGKKWIYLRIIAPDATILPCPDEGCEFEFNGSKGEYTLKREIVYENEALEMCVYWDVKDELKPGEYIVEIYSDAADIGKSKIVLK